RPMKPRAFLLCLFLLGCEKRVISAEDSARNAVIEWIKIHRAERHQHFFGSIEKVISVGDGVLVLYELRAVPSYQFLDNGIPGIFGGVCDSTRWSRLVIPYLVRSNGGTLKVEEGYEHEEIMLQRMMRAAK
ncbi:MAG: hypothetical protein AAF591_23385, partial [Verrucomicrobiota bacterium]